jgi:hypothetical protein
MGNGRREELREELDRVASEIDGGLLSFASRAARHEWMSVRSRWGPASNATTIVEDDLVVVVQKVRRFSAILRTLQAEGVGPADRGSTKP